MFTFSFSEIFSTFIAVLLLTLSALQLASSNHETTPTPSYSWQQPSLCRSDTSYPTTQLYGLEMNIFIQSRSYMYSRKRSDVVLTVYAKNCPNLETIGPTWYRLEPIPPIKGLGSYHNLLSKSGAIIKDEGIEFNGTDEPLTILDLPRTYTWITNKNRISEACFKLTIQHGDFCEQIVTPDCEDINMTTPSSTTTSSISSTIAAPSTIIVPTVPPTSATSETKPDCHKFNCTGRRESQTCGSDGIYYANVCKLRLHKCLNNMKTLQRDRTGKSCNTNMTTPTVATTPTIPPDQTCRRNKYTYPQIYANTKCDWRGLHKPIQCHRRREDDVIVCVCMNPIAGSTKGNDWEMNCTDYDTTVPQGRCSI